MATEKFSELDRSILIAVQQLGANAYGVPLREQLKCSIWKLYNWLHRMETQGYLQSRNGEETLERSGRPKRFYTLTPLGQEALKGKTT
jgi:DNA-binding PadR family transcriptional regulator